MKKVKWKILVVTSIVCLLPIILGLLIWDKLPDSIAIHFDINNNPDNFTSKSFAVFGLPVMMALFQILCCIINDINAHKYGDEPKAVALIKWIIPFMCVVLQVATFVYALGIFVDIRRVASVIVGVIFVVTGVCLPKFNHVRNFRMDAEKAKKVNHFMGILSFVLGIIFIITSFLSVKASIFALFGVVIYILVTLVYSIYTLKKK